jgi:signal transduction histidine kinase
MYLVNGLVRAHGGSVTIGDAEGGGARVELTWPAADHEA